MSFGRISAPKKISSSNPLSCMHTHTTEPPEQNRNARGSLKLHLVQHFAALAFSWALVPVLPSAEGNIPPLMQSSDRRCSSETFCSEVTILIIYNS